MTTTEEDAATLLTTALGVLSHSLHSMHSYDMVRDNDRGTVVT